MAIEKIKIYCDGGSRGNPGPAAAGVVFLNSDNKLIAEYNEYLGIQTNNFAEYRAVTLALAHLGKYKNCKIEFYLDSMLVVKQLSGEYKVKNANIKPLYQDIVSKLAGLDVSFTHVYREDNKLADAQVNICLDSHAQ